MTQATPWPIYLRPHVSPSPVLTCLLQVQVHHTSTGTSPMTRTMGGPVLGSMAPTWIRNGVSPQGGHNLWWETDKGINRASCTMTEGSIKGGPSTEEGSTSISSTEQSNSNPGFDVCVGVYQVEWEGQEHPKAAFKYFPIQIQEVCPQMCILY